MPVTQEISFIISISYQSEAAEELVSSGEFRSPHSPYEPAQGSCGLALALLGEDCLSLIIQHICVGRLDHTCCSVIKQRHGHC